MQMDAGTTFSDAQNLAQAAGTYLSDKSVDLGVTGSDAFGGSPAGFEAAKTQMLQLLVQVVTAFTSGGSGTLQVNLISADDAALTTNVTVLSSTAVLALATLVAGYKFKITGRLPPGITQRYIGLQYVIGTAAMTAGKVLGALVIDEQTA